MIQIRSSGLAGEAATLDAPLDHLMACHRRIEERLATLERAGAALAGRKDEALLAIRAAFLFMDSNGAIHTRDEEESLFPRLQGRMTETEAALVAALQVEHEEAERIYLRLKDIVDRADANEPGTIQEFVETAAGLCELYRKHIATEDSRLMEVARRGLTEADLTAISGEMKVRRGLS